MNSLQIKNGVIRESYHFTMDGEYCSGYKEHNVEVTEWWKSGTLTKSPKEVKTIGSLYTIYFRHTKQNGWRHYDKYTKTFKLNIYTGKSVSFISNINTNNRNDYNTVNLGHW